MKAIELSPGDVIQNCPDEPGLEGWTVAWMHLADWDTTDGDRSETCVLLKLERRNFDDPLGDMQRNVWNPTARPVRTYRNETRTAWLPADAEVEL